MKKGYMIHIISEKATLPLVFLSKEAAYDYLLEISKEVIVRCNDEDTAALNKFMEDIPGCKDIKLKEVEIYE